jgi:hypothetical protein
LERIAPTKAESWGESDWSTQSAIGLLERGVKGFAPSND